MKIGQQREINIVNNKILGKLMKKLGRLNLNSWYSVSLTNDNEISILGTQWKVEFIDENEGNWFEIVDIVDEVIRLKKFDNFSLIYK